MRLFLLTMLAFVLFSKAHSYSLQSACELAEDPKSCHSSLLQDPRSSRASPKNLTIIALEKSLGRVESVYDLIPPLSWAGRAFDRQSRDAIADCLTFYDLAVHHLKDAQIRLSRSSSSDLKWSHAVHIQTLLSAAHTNQRTCQRELQHAHVNLSQLTFTAGMHDASVAVSDSLALVKKLWILGRAPESQKRRLSDDGNDLGLGEDGFPWWASRKLVQSFETSQKNAIVAQDGSGNHRTIAEAIAAVPEDNPNRYVIRIRGGVYRENIEIPYHKPNIMFVGDGIDATVITTARNTADGYSMPKTPAVAVFANGFVARDLTFQNTAGPTKSRGLALLVQSDKAAFYRCKLEGYQDTLYAYALRQYYRECEIYGTIDFICGNPIAVFQKCGIHVRTPIRGEGNVVTAQDRVNPTDNSAIVLDNCVVTWSKDASSHDVETFLGRPWGSYSRTIVMNSRLDSLIDPRGWTTWGARDDSKTVYYGEYRNSGPGADTSRRVKWPGVHVLSAASARPYTASAFLQLKDWLPAGIPGR